MPMAYVAGANIVGSLIGANAARQAGAEQAAGSRYAADINKQMFDTQNEQQAPYRQAGYTALGEIGNLKDYLTSQFTPETFAANIDPGYAFRLQQGTEAANRAANVGGGMIGGNALKGLEDYTQGLASTEFGNAFNRFQTNRSNIYNTLASIAGLGQTSLGQTTAAGTTAAGNIGANIANASAAQAGGTVGAANALSGGLQNTGNTYMLSQLLGQRTPMANYGLTSGGGMTTSYAPNNVDMGGAQGLRMGGGQGLIPSNFQMSGE